MYTLYTTLKMHVFFNLNNILIHSNNNVAICTTI